MGKKPRTRRDIEQRYVSIFIYMLAVWVITALFAWGVWVQVAIFAILLIHPHIFSIGVMQSSLRQQFNVRLTDKELHNNVRVSVLVLGVIYALVFKL